MPKPRNIRALMPGWHLLMPLFLCLACKMPENGRGYEGLWPEPEKDIRNTLLALPENNLDPLYVCQDHSARHGVVLSAEESAYRVRYYLIADEPELKYEGLASKSLKAELESYTANQNEVTGESLKFEVNRSRMAYSAETFAARFEVRLGGKTQLLLDWGHPDYFHCAPAVVPPLVSAVYNQGAELFLVRLSGRHVKKLSGPLFSQATDSTSKSALGSLSIDKLACAKKAYRGGFSSTDIKNEDSCILVIDQNGEALELSSLDSISAAEIFEILEMGADLVAEEEKASSRHRGGAPGRLYEMGVTRFGWLGKGAVFEDNKAFRLVFEGFPAMDLYFQRFYKAALVLGHELDVQQDTNSTERTAWGANSNLSCSEREFHNSEIENAYACQFIFDLNAQPLEP